MIVTVKGVFELFGELLVKFLRIVAVLRRIV